MRTIERTSQFRKDYKREAKGKYKSTLEADFISVIQVLAEDKQLQASHRDHALTGNWKPNRDCHIKPDLVLIYQKPDETTLLLVRLGSHSELDI